MKIRTALYVDASMLAAIDARIDGVHVASRNAFIVRAIASALEIRIVALPLTAWGHNGARGQHVRLTRLDGAPLSDEARERELARAIDSARATGLDTVFTYV